MSVTIDGVPETVTRDDYLALIRAYGFEPERLKSLTFGANSITAEVFAWPKVIDPRSDRALVHSVVIKVED